MRHWPPTPLPAGAGAGWRREQLLKIQIVGIRDGAQRRRRRVELCALDSCERHGMDADALGGLFLGKPQRVATLANHLAKTAARLFEEPRMPRRATKLRPGSAASTRHPWYVTDQAYTLQSVSALFDRARSAGLVP